VNSRNTKLVAISGPARGESYELSGGEVSIGRSSSNDIRVEDLALSRRHAMVVKQEGRFAVRDLESNNGTFLNGAPVLEAVLTSGDRISMGDSVFVFISADDAKQPRCETAALVETTVEVVHANGLYAEPERIVQAPGQESPVSEDLKILLRVCRELNSSEDLRDLQERLLRVLCETFGACRGAILLTGDSETDLSIVGWDHEAGERFAAAPASPLLDRVLREKLAVIAAEAPENPRLPAVTVIACPILRPDRILGAIWLTGAGDTQFDERRLLLLTAVSGFTAPAIENAQRLADLREQNRLLENAGKIDHGLVGDSPAMLEVFGMIRKLACGDSSVLIFGESGTGKELAARAIHLNSARSKGPFLALNCAALTESLFESEFFGHEKGAFTGAYAQQKGKMELAQGGTLLLDEVGELTQALQAKLLRTLQEREFQRVGGARTIRVDVRVIAATNRDLREAVRAKTFREDLYYRLNVISFTMPSLRERKQDIPLLAQYFAAKFGTERRAVRISRRVLTILQAYHWPGNVRELANVIEHAICLGVGDEITPEDLPSELLEVELTADAEVPAYHAAVRRARQQIVERAFVQASGNHVHAAAILGLHPNNLHRLVRTLQIQARLHRETKAPDGSAHH